MVAEEMVHPNDHSREHDKVQFVEDCKDQFWRQLVYGKSIERVELLLPFQALAMSITSWARAIDLLSSISITRHRVRLSFFAGRQGLLSHGLSLGPCRTGQSGIDLATQSLKDTRPRQLR